MYIFSNYLNLLTVKLNTMSPFFIVNIGNVLTLSAIDDYRPVFIKFIFVFV